MRRPATRSPAAALIALSCIAIAACGTGGSAPRAVSSTPVYTFGVVGSAGKLLALAHDRPTIVPGIRGKVVEIATSNSDGYALTSAGAVWAWGIGTYGELGDGKTSPYATTAVRVTFPQDVKIVALPNPMPFDAGLAIDSRGNVWGWGLNGSHDLCLGGVAALRPQRLPLSDVTLATGARTHTLFDSHGKLYACGSGDAGELGDGSTRTSTTPTPVKGLPDNARVTELVSAWEDSGALLSNGAYYDWGYNADGQLADAHATNSDLPVHVKLPAAVRQVSQGGSGARNGQTLVILANHTVWAWGNGRWGQLGNGTTTNSLIPARVTVPAGVSFAYVNSGGYSSYAIDTRGQLWAWGGNNRGQLGTGTRTRATAEPADVGIRLTQVSSTASNTAGLGG